MIKKIQRSSVNFLEKFWQSDQGQFLYSTTIKIKNWGWLENWDWQGGEYRIFLYDLIDEYNMHQKLMVIKL